MERETPNFDLTRALAGVRVCDLSQGIAGPHATMLLAQFGAEVIKVEPPEGDWGRLLGTRAGDHCVHSWQYNLGKKSLALDLKKPEGKVALQRLAETCDVFVESFRPGVAARLGFSYEDVKALRPDVIYASVSGFGQSGPNSQRGTVDSLMQGFSGMMVMNRTAQGVPHRQNMVAVDVLTGVYLHSLISTALHRRRLDGTGGFLDVSLMQAAAAFQSAKIAEFHASGGEPKAFYGPVGYLPTRDGAISVSCRVSAHFETLCTVVQRPDLALDRRFDTSQGRVDYHDQLMELLGQVTAQWETARLLDALQTAGVLAERVQSYGQWLEDPHVRHCKAFRWQDAGALGVLPLVELPGTEARGAEAVQAPDIDQDGERILRGLGFSDPEIAKIRLTRSAVLLDGRALSA